MDVINAATGGKVRYSEKEERVDMCVALREIREEGRIEGVITFAKKLGLQKESVKKSIMDDYEKTDGEAEELIKIYWK